MTAAKRAGTASIENVVPTMERNLRRGVNLIDEFEIEPPIDHDKRPIVLPDEKKPRRKPKGAK